MLQRMSHLVRTSALALGLWLALAAVSGLTALQQSNAPAQIVDVEGVGPKVGEALPEFSLRDQDGQVHSLKSLLGSKGAVIVFFRSADW
jgi:cytochrome oxidase Cu insertion factor (SCO1/SenC/PrrC family)